MKAALLFTGSGPLVVLTSHAFTGPTLLEKLGAKGIDKFIAYEIPLDTSPRSNHFQVVLRDLHEADDLRVLDFNGQRAFGLFHLSELGSPIFVENGRAG